MKPIIMKRHSGSENEISNFLMFSYAAVISPLALCHFPCFKPCEGPKTSGDCHGRCHSLYLVVKYSWCGFSPSSHNKCSPADQISLSVLPLKIPQQIFQESFSLVFTMTIGLVVLELSTISKLKPELSLFFLPFRSIQPLSLVKN